MEKRKEAGNFLPIMDYEGNKIAFEIAENHEVKVNVTQFAKCFPEKNLSKIVNSQEISEYVERLAKITNVSLADLLEVRNGGTPGTNGTWANRKVALRIAQKLNVDFAIAVDMKIEELLFGNQKQVSIYNQSHLNLIVSSLTRKEKRMVGKFLLNRTGLYQKDIAHLLDVSEKAIVSWKNSDDDSFMLDAFEDDENLRGEIMETILDVTNRKTRKALYEQFNKVMGGLV